ncbi:MAG: hypothetical protein AAFR68_24070, partial [Pseudomonadota bacterium]
RALVILEQGLNSAQLCSIFDTLRPAGRFAVFEGERQYRYFIGDGIAADALVGSDCVEETG